MTKIYKNLVKGVTRMNENYNKNVMAWVEAEKKLGLTKSIFILQKNGNLTQYYDYDEGEIFHNNVIKMLKRKGEFNELCELYLDSLKRKNFVEIFIALTVFNEIDEYQLGDFSIQKKLLRIREETHEEIYKI